jgi:PPOX class probable F420-dependent enzyme
MMTTFEEADLLAYMQASRLAVVSSLAADGAPQSALVGVAVTDGFEIIFDTTESTRKHANLRRDPRVSVVVAGPGEQTLQFEGVATPLPTRGEDGADLRETYYAAWPDGRARLDWPGLVYWRVSPRWARYSDFDRGLVKEFRWP